MVSLAESHSLICMDQQPKANAEQLCKHPCDRAPYTESSNFHKEFSEVLYRLQDIIYCVQECYKANTPHLIKNSLADPSLLQFHLLLPEE